MNDIWVIEEHLFWIFWGFRGTGTELEVKTKLAEMNGN